MSRYDVRMRMIGEFVTLVALCAVASALYSIFAVIVHRLAS
jgi:hypothetical protein